MIRVFIGYDSREPIAYHVLAHSIMRHCSDLVQITPLVLSQLDLPGPKEGSTEFTRSRFLVPSLCGFKGWAIFMDCDMLCREDLMKVWSSMDDVDPDCAVSVVKHDYTPRPGPKFLGHAQTEYPCKNWSSFMVFNNAKCRGLSLDYVRHASLMDLHQFQWGLVGALPQAWNYLVGEPVPQMDNPFVVHYTRGGPWFPEYANCEFAGEWCNERIRMLQPSS